MNDRFNNKVLCNSRMTDSTPSILGEIEKVQTNVKAFKEQSKLYYFDVLFSKYRCPVCTKKPLINGLSQAECVCGYSFDPTLEFQRSHCCNTHLLRQIYHYVCSCCGKYVKSLFLFDERLFDKEYFREMMAKSRERKHKRVERYNSIVRERSHELLLCDEFNLEDLDNFSTDLNELIETDNGPLSQDTDPGTEEFDMISYRKHLLLGLDSDEFLFNSITPLSNDSRKDRTWKFITLIFMEHEREVWLTQYGNDILVERYEAHC